LWDNSLGEEGSDGHETASRKAEKDVGRRGKSAVFGGATTCGSRRLRATACASGGTKAGAARAPDGTRAGGGSSCILDLEPRRDGVNIAVVGWVDKLDSITGSDFKGHVGDSITLRGDVDIFVNRKSPIEDVHIAVHDKDRNGGRVTRVVAPGDGIAGVLDPIVVGIWTGDLDRRESESGKNGESEEGGAHFVKQRNGRGEQAERRSTR